MYRLALGHQSIRIVHHSQHLVHEIYFARHILSLKGNIQHTRHSTHLYIAHCTLHTQWTHRSKIQTIQRPKPNNNSAKKNYSNLFDIFNCCPVHFHAIFIFSFFLLFFSTKKKKKNVWFPSFVCLRCGIAVQYAKCTVFGLVLPKCTVFGLVLEYLPCENHLILFLFPFSFFNTHELADSWFEWATKKSYNNKSTESAFVYVFILFNCFWLLILRLTTCGYYCWVSNISIHCFQRVSDFIVLNGLQYFRRYLMQTTRKTKLLLEHYYLHTP